MLKPSVPRLCSGKVQSRLAQSHPAPAIRLAGYAPLFLAQRAVVGHGTQA